MLRYAWNNNDMRAAEELTCGTSETRRSCPWPVPHAGRRRAAAAAEGIRQRVRTSAFRLACLT